MRRTADEAHNCACRSGLTPDRGALARPRPWQRRGPAIGQGV